MGREKTRFRTTVACALCGLCVQAVLSAAPPARTIYSDTLAREQTVRTALSSPDAPADVLADVHAVITTYESLVRRYPASDYSDNALWQAGRLALDAYARFGQAADRDAGVKLLRRLAAGYPTSKFVGQVPATLAALDGEEAVATSAVPKPRTASAAEPTSVATRGVGAIATIRNIRRTVLADAVRVTIELDAEVSFHDGRIADPDRVFLDLPATRPSAALADKTLRFAA